MRRAHWAAAIAVAGVGVLAAWPPVPGVAQPQPQPQAQAQKPAAVAEPPREAPATLPAGAFDLEPDPRVLRFYDVSDLIAGITQIPRDAVVVPPSMLRTPDAAPGGNPSLMGSSYVHRDPVVGAMPLKDLVSLLQAEADAVTAAGAPMAGVDEIGGLIAVRQTPAGQQRVADTLAALRAARPVGRGVAVDAHWLLLAPADAAGVVGGSTVDRRALAALPPTALYARSSARLVTGQKATVVAGRARTAVTEQDPQVGSAVAAYDPVVEYPLAGALLRVGVAVAGDVATVDVAAAAGDWHEPGKPAAFRSVRGSVPATVPTEVGGTAHYHSDPLAGYDAVAEIDRLNVTAFDLTTTVKVPLGQPTVVGGMTIEPATGLAPGKGDPRQLYLVLEVNLAAGELPHVRPAP